MVLEAVVDFLVGGIGTLGYVGIFCLMFLESSFFPFPSEVVMVPAGYLVFQGEMSLFAVVLIGVLGCVAGSWFNYFLADKFGRRVLLKFLKRHHLIRVEEFFRRHGHFSIFNARLVPVVRQYISFPAGLAKMNPWKFSLYTALGSGVWVSVLVGVGYFLGQNEVLIVEYLRGLTLLVLVMVLIGSVFYVWKNKR